MVRRLRQLVTAPFSFNAIIRPRTALDDSISLDHVVGAAILVPVAHRRIERYGLAIKRHAPVRGRERSYYALPAAAAARMHCRRVLHRDVQHPRLKLARRVPDKPMLESVMPDQD